MARKNHRSGRRPQARRRADGTTSGRRPPPLPIEQMIVPKGKCFFRARHGKVIFRTEEEAQKALAQAQANRARKGTGHAESRYYSCPEGGCGGFHLTSRTTYEDRSAS